jgi:hypothetical protein
MTHRLASPAYFMPAIVPESLAPLALPTLTRGIAMRHRFGSMDGMHSKRSAAVTLPGRIQCSAQPITGRTASPGERAGSRTKTVQHPTSKTLSQMRNLRREIFAR